MYIVRPLKCIYDDKNIRIYVFCSHCFLFNKEKVHIEGICIGMAFLRLLVIIRLTFIVATAFLLDDDPGNGSQTAINYRLPDNVVPVHYNIKLIPYLVRSNFTFNGEANIDIVIRRVTQDLRLHALQLTIDEAATTLIDSDGVVHTPKAHNYERETEILNLKFDNELQTGNYTLNIKFVGILNPYLQGFFRTFYYTEEEDYNEFMPEDDSM